MDTVFWGSYNKDPTIWGTILGFPIFGNTQMGEGGYSFRTGSLLSDRILHMATAHVPPSRTVSIALIRV